MSEVTFLDHTRTAFDIAHDEARFAKLGLNRDTLLAKMAEAATEIAGWGAGNEAATMRAAMDEIIRLRAKAQTNTTPPDGEGRHD